jgi:hypothetical protein
MRPKTGEGPDAANPKLLLAFQERIYLLLPAASAQNLANSTVFTAHATCNG